LSLDRAFRWTGLVGVALFFATESTPLAHALNANRLAAGVLRRSSPWRARESRVKRRYPTRCARCRPSRGWGSRRPRRLRI